MADISVLSEEGWVAIPGEIRARYALKTGDRVQFIDYGGVISIVPLSSRPIDDSCGMLKGETSLLKELLKSRSQEAARGK